MKPNIALNTEGRHAALNIGTDLHDEAYDEGAFFAETDWQWALKEDEAARPSSMAEHRATAWAFISGTVRPEWNDEFARLSFFVGYEDRATELADAGEAGYEVFAEAGTLADTEGWVLQCEPWTAKASTRDKALRAIRGAWAGAARWQALADASGERGDRYRAEEALRRAATAGDCGRTPGYVAEAATQTHPTRRSLSALDDSVPVTPPI